MYNKIVLLSFLCCVATILFGKELTVFVVSTDDEVIEYAKIAYNKSIEVFTNEQGVCKIEELQEGMSLEVSAWNFVSQKRQITKDVLEKDTLKISLSPQIYDLAEIVVIHKGDMGKVFRKNLNKNTKLHLNTKISELTLSSEQHKKVKYSYNENKVKFEVDSTDVARLHLGDKIVRGIESVLKLNFTLPISIMKKRQQKKYNCTYLGKEGDLSLWRFSKKQKYRVEFGMKEDDELECTVFLDKFGIIKRVKTRMLTNNKSSSSYFLDTHFLPKKDTLVAQRSLFEAVPLGARTEEVVRIELSFRKK